MAEVKKALINHLMNTAGVTALFGNRVYVDKLPDNVVYPCARLWLVTSPKSYSHDKQNTRTATVQVDIYDDDQAGADAAIEAIDAALSGHKGQMGDMSAGYVFTSRGAEQWNETTRSYWRILEIKIGTND